MLGHKRSIIHLLTIPILLGLPVLFLSCGEKPAGIQDKTGDAGGFTGRGEVDPGGDSDFLLGTATDTLFASGYIEVWATNLAYDTVAGDVSFDVTLRNATDRDIYAPVRFVITWLSPWDVFIKNADGKTGDGFLFFDFSEKLGPDDVLEVGEVTDAAKMIFHTGEPRSFGVGFRIDLELHPDAGTITGVVYRDDNRNGKRDRCEPGIPGITIGMQNLSDTLEVIHITRTDVHGEYSYSNLGEGIYRILAQVPPGWEATSSNPLLVTLLRGPDGKVQNFLGANFGLFPKFVPSDSTIFGPVMVGPASLYGTELDTTFTAYPSMIVPKILEHHLEVNVPDILGPFPIVIDTAAVWINDTQVFNHSGSTDSVFVFFPVDITLDPGILRYGENEIRMLVDGNEWAVLSFRVYRRFCSNCDKRKET